MEVITLSLMLMYVVLRLGGRPMNNKVYSPRKQSFLDKLENIPVHYISPLPSKDKPMPIGTEAMKQLKDLAKNDALSLNLDKTLEGFNKTYEDYKPLEDAVDQMVEQQNLTDAHANVRGGLQYIPDEDQMLVETEPMPTIEEDQVNAPSHYMLWPDTEVIDIIKRVLTDEELAGWYKGNSLKYRLRLGAKDIVERDLGKAEKFELWLGDLY